MSPLEVSVEDRRRGVRVVRAAQSSQTLTTPPGKKTTVAGFHEPTPEKGVKQCPKEQMVAKLEERRRKIEGILPQEESLEALGMQASIDFSC